jgi:hypothetical protein
LTNDADAGSVGHVADAASIGVLIRAPPSDNASVEAMTGSQFATATGHFSHDSTKNSRVF